jgi:hypothetical protein
MMPNRSEPCPRENCKARERADAADGAPILGEILPAWRCPVCSDFGRVVPEVAAAYRLGGFDGLQSLRQKWGAHP